MNLRVILLTVLLVLILLGMLTFAYLTYTLYQDSTQDVGKALVGKHQLLYYVQLSMYLLTFATGVGLVFKG